MQQDSLNQALQAALPSVASRSSAYFIILFLLAILFLLLFFKMQEADKKEKEPQ